MVGDSVARDSWTDPRDPLSRFGAAAQYARLLSIPWSMTAGITQPANKPSELNVLNQFQFVVQQQLASQTGMPSVRSFNSKLAWSAPSTTGA